jgi:hypothetical protein
MKEELYHGIKMYKLSGRETKKYILNNKGAFDPEFSKSNRIYTYVFQNGSYLYDFNAHAFLFTTKEDLLKFNSITNELADKELNAQKIDHLDAKFIKNVNSLIFDFELFYKLKFDFDKLDDLKRLDSLINHLKDKKSFKITWKYNLIAIVGQFLIGQLKTANWAVHTINGVSDVIISDGQVNLYDPIHIVDKEINYYLEEDGKVAFFDHAEIELIQYKVFDKILKQ